MNTKGGYTLSFIGLPGAWCCTAASAASASDSHVSDAYVGTSLLKDTGVARSLTKLAADVRTHFSVGSNISEPNRTSWA